MDGVTAAVNYATEKATVSFPETVRPDELVAVVEQTGYTATVPPSTHQVDGPSAPAPEAERAAELAVLRQRLIVSAVLSVPVVLLAMVPAWQFTYWQWLSLTLAAPVVVWAAGRSTVLPGSTCGTAPPPWTPSSRWARWPPSVGPWRPCSSVRLGCPA